MRSKPDPGSGQRHAGHAEREAAVVRFLKHLGFGPSLIRRQYPIWLGRSVERVDVAAFAKGNPKDMTTSAAIGGVMDSKTDTSVILDAARALASPAVVVALPDTLELWSVASSRARDTRVAASAYSEMDQMAGRFSEALNPVSLLEAKAAGKQLPLFPIDVHLLNAARAGSKSELSDRVEEAMGWYLNAGETDDRLDERLIQASRLVVGALAALVVRDKLLIESTTWKDMVHQATDRFPGYFDTLTRTMQVSESAAEECIRILGEGVNYESLDSQVISDVYENAVVSESERLRLGIYYTPPDLAKRIVEHIPFEELDPEQRVVLDPACGSGTLLLAAHDRMLSLSPARWDPLQEHTYLTSHLVGFDTDSFAVEIARLSLLLNALPAGNSWDIRQQDILPLNPEAIAPRPAVVVSNPPWSDIRPPSAKREQRADRFLAWMLKATRPQGFVAAVLPAAWLSSNTSRDARELLDSQATVIELWRLAEGVFASRLAPCVLIAQVDSGRGRRYVFRRVLHRPSSPVRFASTGVADEEYLTLPNGSIKPDLPLRGPLDLAKKQLTKLPRLGDLAIVQNGPVPKPPVRERGGAGQFLWLRTARDLPPFGEPPSRAIARVRFPEDFHRAGNHPGAIFGHKKVLVSAARWPNNPWRLKVALDLQGLIPRQTLHMVVPKQGKDATLFALLALLGSSVASCWIDTYETKLDISAQLLREMPVPASPKSWRELAAIGRKLFKYSGGDRRLPLALNQLEKTVWRAYKLNDETIDALKCHFGGFSAPGGERFPAPVNREYPEPAAPRHFGATIDAEDNRLRLWSPGFTSEDGDWINLPPRFIGWHCVPGATFEFYGEDLASASFVFQRRAFRQETDLARQAD
jgi:hypothetical protein